ncbi:MAG: RagB/SusD family nutrient uptake outer membrane protein [Saprospiraceae bacterium]|nr:RagB/SusD family nutrient uptake outer membrane protein [Saprospiraceae bacterium]
MKKIFYYKIMIMVVVLSGITACENKLQENPENVSFTGDIDYSVSDNMILPVIGAYGKFNELQWENFPLISVRGDDVNAGGLGDQQPYADTDNFTYDTNYWMYNSVWLNFYGDIISYYTAIDEINKYRDAGASSTMADQYIAEVKTLSAFSLFQLSRLWGSILIPTSADRSELLVKQVATKAEVMQFISDQMDEAIPYLPDLRPNERQDIVGGVTKYTALAMKALANLEMKNYPGVAAATGQIISSGKFTLDPDFYELFKIPGKLSDESLLEFQYTDQGTGSGPNTSYLYAFFGPQNWTPAVAGAGAGWGFYEPSKKYIEFMLDRGETVRLETSVIFTNRGIAELEADGYTNLPSFVSNTTRDGDVFDDYPRALFASGKHYLPSNQLIPGRTSYGSNNNFRAIRYAEVLLMYAEALTQGASGSAMTADQAVNLVRTRSNMPALSGVTNQQVMDEKFAELAMEWGIRYYDMIRLGNTSALSYDGRTFTEDKAYLPYPQTQVDQLPNLTN